MTPSGGAFVSWMPYHGRSQGFIDTFQLAPVYVSYLGMERPALAPLKYGPQAIATLRALARQRPALVFVMNPPPLATVTALLYCAATRARFVMDCHGGVFEDPKWTWLLPLQRVLMRRAAAVIVTNPVHLETVTGWGARGTIMSDPPPLDHPTSTLIDRRPGGRPCVFTIVRFGRDEAIQETLRAARLLPGVDFLISGDTRRADPQLLRQAPANARFSGWLSLPEFWGRVRRANVILTLTTIENSILRGGWEAMFTSQPLVTSDTAALRAYFTRGAVFVSNTAPDIATGVRLALAQESDLRREMESLRLEKLQTWAREREQLESILGVALTAELKPQAPTMIAS